jgi:radical SAM protein with 4Fe4S-binding SPASM domain
MSVSIGVGLTNDCDLHCAHCYRNASAISYLHLQDLRVICERFDVTSFNFGTGESYLHPEFPEIVEFLGGRGYKLSMASNGYSLTAMPQPLLLTFHDVEVSIDFASADKQDSFRGENNWQCAMGAIERCKQVGVEVTILATLMSINFEEMDTLAELAKRLQVNLRVNVYQPVRLGDYSPSFEQYWEGYRRLFSSSRLVSTSEPVVNAMLGLDGLRGCPCGRQSIRVTPDGNIIPCVYWPDRDLTLADLPDMDEMSILDSEMFCMTRVEPEACQDCPHLRSCGGGCASRRRLLNRLDQPDPYCPLPRGQEIQLDFDLAPAKDLPRARNVCTTIVTV